MGRFGFGTLATAVGAVVALLALPLSWYSLSGASDGFTGWDFTRVRWLVVAAAVVAFAGLVVPRSRISVLLRALVAAAAAVVIFLRIVSPPGDGLDPQAGIYVALLGAVLLLVGAVLSAGRQVAEDLGYEMPPGGLGVPRRPQLGPGGTGATENRTEVVDAQVVDDPAPRG